MASPLHNQLPLGRVATADIDAGLREYMLRVYNYMTAGLAVSGLLALFAAQPSIAPMIWGTPLAWVVIFAPLAMVFFLSARIHAMSFSTAQISFWVFAALMGLSLSSIFLQYSMGSIARVFFITSGTFAGMSLWGYTTSRNLSGFGSFLMMGLIGIIIAMLVNIFLASTMMDFVISVLGVLIFTGLTAYDTQRVKESYFEGDEAETAGKKAIMGALTLYLDFINLFIMLLRLFGSSRE
jgi:uncharacterized protein